MNKSALDALLTSPEAWETYRTSLKGGTPDLARANLANANLTRANLTGANLTLADLTNANLTYADLTHADLTRANLTRANFIDADLTDADFARADLVDANLANANLTNANFTDADLTDANLTRASLASANLTYADLTRANLTRADLTNANLTEAILTRANLPSADLTRANFTDADLTLANLIRANFTDANLTRADLTSARVNLGTITPAGQSFQSTLQGDSAHSPLDVGTIRLQLSLPSTIDPQLLADLTSSVAVMARLASRVGSRLGRDWLDEPSSGLAGTLLIKTDEESTFIRVLRTHYGSPWWIDLTEVGPSVLSGAAAAGTGAAAFALRKHNQKLLSFLLMLARREERKLWFDSRVEHQRYELEQKRANTAGEKARRFESEAAIASLRIHEASEAELRQRVIESIPDPEARIIVLDAIPHLMPLIGGGITALMARDDQVDPKETS